MIPQSNKGLSRCHDLSIEGITLFKETGQCEKKACLPQLAKVAVGVLSWPIAQLIKPYRFKGHIIRKVLADDQTTAAIEWEVTPDSKLGMPTMLSLRLLFAFCKLAWEFKRQIGVRPDWLPIPSWNKLCESVGVPPVQAYRALLQNHLEILHCTSIRSKCAFKTKTGTEGISDNFFLVPSIRYKGKLDDDGNPFDQTYIRLSKLFLDSIDNDYVKTIDLTFMAELGNDVAQLLYTKVSYLLHKAWEAGRDHEDFDYEWLAETMGLTLWKEKRRAKEQLQPAFETLVRSQYIEKPEWWVDGSWKIRVRPGVRFEFDEQLQLQIRKAAVRKSTAKAKTNLSIPEMRPPSPEDERQTILIRMAMRINTGRKADVDLAALEALGWTRADAERRAAELKCCKK